MAVFDRMHFGTICFGTVLLRTPPSRLMIALLALGPGSLGRAETPTVRPAHVIADLRLELLWVAPGRFLMNSPPQEPERNSGTTHRVAQKNPNAWGFFDMSGNILEWCLDWYGPYASEPQIDPRGPERGHYRVARGGSWRMPARVGRSAARSGGSAAREDYTMGFRLALCATVAETEK